MGSAIGKAADAIGGAVGNAFVAPFKSIFGGSCEGVCSGPWDALCFLEHLCVSDLVKLLMILFLCYLLLMFFYVLLKLGIWQCIVKSLCKMCWASYEAYWFALAHTACFLCHKIKNTKRVNRRRRGRHIQDVEGGYSSSSSGDRSSLELSRKRKSDKEGRLLSIRHGAHRHHRHHRHHRRHRSNSYSRSRKRRKVKARIYGGGSSRRGHVQQRKMRNGEDGGEFKRQRLT